ncbi:MAG: hypothetical protein ACO3RG_03825 [Nitriliruptoraceae bacterium]
MRANASLLLLVLVWVALLLPSAVRSRIRTSPRTSVGGFRRAMDGLRDGGAPPGGRVSPAQPAVRAPRREDPAVARHAFDRLR